MAITLHEYRRLGVFTEIDKLNTLLKERVSGVEQSKYRHVYEAYSIIAQLVSLAKEPTGALRDFNQRVNALRSNLKGVFGRVGSVQIMRVSALATVDTRSSDIHEGTGC